MRLLTKNYFAENKWLVLIGLVSGVVAAMILRGSPVFLVPSVGFFLLGFPYVARTPVARLLRIALIGFCLSLALVYAGRTWRPFAWIGLAGTSILGAVVVCLRYNPPTAEIT